MAKLTEVISNSRATRAILVCLGIAIPAVSAAALTWVTMAENHFTRLDESNLRTSQEVGELQGRYEAIEAMNVACTRHWESIERQIAEIRQIVMQRAAGGP